MKYVTKIILIIRWVWTEEADNSSESRSIKARSTGEGSIGSWRGCG